MKRVIKNYCSSGLSLATYINVVKPCLSQKKFGELESQLVMKIAPLFYSFLKTIGDYEFGLDEDEKMVVEKNDIFWLEITAN